MLVRIYLNFKFIIIHPSLQTKGRGGTATDGYLATTTGSYLYDNNGNMRYDLSKNTNVYYNYLSLPNKVDFIGNNGSINYAYDASGAKLRKTVNTSDVVSSTIDYSGPFIYENNALKSIFTSEGRIAVFEEETAGVKSVLYKFEYNLKDHLGNTRVVFGGHTAGKVEHIQRTDYYPFGLVMNQQNYIAYADLNSDHSPFENKFLYNGKEWQNEEIGGVKLDWYDYGARFYDPALARWHVVDPLAEKYYQWSPYNYSINNPIRYIDPDGNGVLDRVIESATRWVAGKVRDAVVKTATSTVKATKEYAKDVLKNTNVQAKAEVKLSEELGAEFNMKGVVGGGMGMQVSEASLTSETNFNLGNRKLEGKFASDSNRDIKYHAKGQVAGNGASGEYTINEDGSRSSKGEITTSTGVPGVQTESSLELGNNKTEIASGVAIGIKTPVAPSTGGNVVHLSINASLKLVYQKEEE